MKKQSLIKANLYTEGAEKAINWLIRAQDVGDDDGICSHYHLEEGWSSSYPEVTGYIVPTLIRYGESRGRPEIVKRALRSANWLLSLQMERGGFQGRLIADLPGTPVIFNTGMILFGLIESYKITGNRSYMDSAVNAADWLVGNQDADGVWRQFLTLNGTGETHIYHTRVSWALLELYKIKEDEKYLQAAGRNITWALNNQNSKGWFGLNCLFEENNDQPLIHFVAYTIRGILEAGLLLNVPGWIEAAERAAKGIRLSQRRHGGIYARYDKDWEPTVDWKCITGVAQVSIIYMKLFRLTNQPEWLQSADKNLTYLIEVQGKDEINIKGALPGSDPLGGPYMENCYLSWATKFLLEALLLREEINE